MWRSGEFSPMLQNVRLAYRSHSRLTFGEASRAGTTAATAEQARHLPFASPFFRDSLVGKWSRHSNDSGATWTHESSDDDGLYSRSQSRRTRGPESGGQVMTRISSGDGDEAALDGSYTSPANQRIIRLRMVRKLSHSPGKP